MNFFLVYEASETAFWANIFDANAFTKWIYPSSFDDEHNKWENCIKSWTHISYPTRSFKQKKKKKFKEREKLSFDSLYYIKWAWLFFYNFFVQIM